MSSDSTIWQLSEEFLRSCSKDIIDVCPYVSVVQGAAEWTPTFFKVLGKGVVGVGRRGRWQRFGRSSSCQKTP
jgi:hypothetical protein